MSEIKESLKQPIIIDLGSSEIKAGFSGEDKPSLIFKSFIGEPKYKDVFSSIYKENKEIKQYIGEDCLKNIGLLKLHNPIKHGILVNEQEIIPLFNHIYSKLGINTDERREHPLIITEPLLNPYSNREKIANSLFDYIGIPSIFFASQPILSLFSTSATTGIILESGEGVSQSCIIYEGYSLSNTYERYDFGGGDVTEYLKLAMKKKGYQLFNSNEYRLISDMKEKYCFFLPQKYNLNVENVKKALNSKKINYYLPDGITVTLGDERILASEILFNPELIGKEYLGLSDIIFSSINKAEIQLRPKAFENIVLSGGNVLMRGLEDKMKEDIINKCNKIVKINVSTVKEPQISCWVGGNIISSIDIFKKISVGKTEWEEKGSKILHVKTI
jgi:centractin